MHGIDQNLDPREFLLERAGQFQPVHQRQRIIQDRDVRLGIARRLQRVMPVRCLGDDLPAILGFEESPNPLAQGLMIVGNQYPRQWLAHPLPLSTPDGAHDEPAYLCGPPA